MKLGQPSPFDAAPEEAETHRPHGRPEPESEPSPALPDPGAWPDPAPSDIGSPARDADAPNDISDAGEDIADAPKNVSEVPENKRKPPILWAPEVLIHEILHEWRRNYAWMGNMSAAEKLALTTLRRRWKVDRQGNDYVAKRLVHPLDGLLEQYRPYERGFAAGRPAERGAGEPARKESSPAVAEARKRWDEAKQSGDPDRMTRAANDLLRAVEADRAARGEPTPLRREGQRHATSEVLAPKEEGRAAQDGNASDSHASAASAMRMGAEAAATAASDSAAQATVERGGNDMSAAASNFGTTVKNAEFAGLNEERSSAFNHGGIHSSRTLPSTENTSRDSVTSEISGWTAPYITRSLLLEASDGARERYEHLGELIDSDESLTPAGDSVEQEAEPWRQERLEGNGGRGEPLSGQQRRWSEEQIRQASRRFFRDEEIVRQPRMNDAFEHFREEAAERGIDSNTAFHLFRYVADAVRVIAEQMMRDSGMSPEEARQRAIDLVLLTHPRLRKNGWWRDGDTLDELFDNRGYFREGLPPDWGDGRPSWKSYEPLARERRRDALIDFFTWLTGNRDFGRFQGGRLDDVLGLVDRGTSLQELYERRIERDLPWNWWEDPFLILDVAGGTAAKKAGEKVLRRVFGAPANPGRVPILSVFQPNRDSAKRWKQFAPPVEPVVGGVARNGTPVITVTRTRRSLWGFTPETFTAVRERFVGQVRAAGYADARIGIVGSATTGRSFRKGKAFDAKSDLDLAIVSKTMMDMIRSRRELLGIGVRSDNKASYAFFEEEFLRALGLDDLIDEIKRLTGRKKVTIRVYESEKAMGAQRAREFFDFSLGWEGM
jgi:hypothetical protein